METANVQVNEPAAMTVQPDAATEKEVKASKQVLAVEVMNGIVFAVILMLFGLTFGVFASQTFAAI